VVGLAELRTQIQIAYEVGYLDKEFYEAIEAECVELGKRVGSLILKRGNRQ
jgi:four helix bundle protein